MSKIRKMVEQRINFIAEEDTSNFVVEPDFIPYSVRLPVDVSKNLDIISERLEMKKSDVVRDFLAEAVKEALIVLKVDPMEWAHSEYKNLEKGEENE